VNVAKLPELVRKTYSVERPENTAMQQARSLCSLP